MAKSSCMRCITGRKHVTNIRWNLRAIYAKILLKSILLKERGVESPSTLPGKESGRFEAGFRSELKSKFKARHHSSLRRMMCCAAVWDLVHEKLCGTRFTGRLRINYMNVSGLSFGWKMHKKNHCLQDLRGLILLGYVKGLVYSMQVNKICWLA